jgi:hypothetical protein
VLLALHGLDAEFGESLADVELGLALRDLSLMTVVEPKSHVVAGAAQGAGARSYQEALSAEKLYRRHRVPSAMSAIGHAFLVVGEMLSGFPRARMITCPWGRWAARHLDLRPRYESRLELARAELAREHKEVSTIRMDSLPGMKNRRSGEQRGRRSAA